VVWSSCDAPGVPDEPRHPPAPVVRLRPALPDDEAAVLALNLAEEVSLAPMDSHRLAYLRSRADRFDVIEVDGGPAGFVVTMAPGGDYESPNYRWFAERYGADFYYLDRIALAPTVRRRGVAGRVYDEVEAVAAARGRMALEVNLVRPNPASLAFHTRRGYAEVGRLGDEEHLVVLLVKELRGDRETR
jgi:uncharacterized protein